MPRLTFFRKAGDLLFPLLLAVTATAQPMREAPNGGAAPVNQLAVAGNACGPAALLCAFRFGDANWQRVAEAVPGNTERERILSIIRKEGSRPSRHLGNRVRWSKQGVNVADLCDMANEMTIGHYRPQIQYEILFLKAGETQEQLLKRSYARMEKSLAKGLPPLISIRRFALRKQAGGETAWTIIDGHFVTVTAVPKKLEKGARSFEVAYVDPWGGKRCRGKIAIGEKAFLQGGNGVPDPMVSPCLEAVFPEASVGKKQLRAGEPTVVTLAAAIGRW